MLCVRAMGVQMSDGDTRRVNETSSQRPWRAVATHGQIQIFPKERPNLGACGYRPSHHNHEHSVWFRRRQRRNYRHDFEVRRQDQL